jgi:hypothetical protein
MSKPKRERLVHTYFDRAIGKHQIFVYNKNQTLIAHLTISPEGTIEVFQGAIKQ